MSRPLYRGFSTGSRSSSGGFSSNGSDPFDPSDDNYNAKQSHENGLSHEFFSKSRKGLSIFLLKLGIATITILALIGSLSWAISISSSSKSTTTNLGYRRLQEQLIADLLDISSLSLGISKSKEIEFCPPEFENYVPCYYNLSETADLIDTESHLNSQKERECSRGSAIQCLILPPRNYRIPLRWPSGKDFIWKENVKITGQEFSSGSLTKRMMVEEEQISFRSDSLMVDGVEDYSHQIAEMIGLRNESNFNEAGIRTVLDIGCGFGSFGAHLFSKNVLTMCIADYEGSGSQVQLTLERGLPALIGSFTAKKQLPYPFLSFDMVHCARCEIAWDKNDGIYLIEVDRLLRPGGYFVWTSLMNTHRSLREKENQKKWNKIREFCEDLCWELLSQQEETVVWKKTSSTKCYNNKKSGFQICGKNQDIESPYYSPLNPCISGTKNQRWVPIDSRTPWPFQNRPNSTELEIHGINPDEFSSDASTWSSAIPNYWSLLSPLIFSDHPKRPGDEEPHPPFNMLRNVLDMNAGFGGFNEALLDAEKSAWVMNVVPVINGGGGYSYLASVFDRGFVGVQHDWCESFPTYPRTYDLVHAHGLLTLEKNRKGKCSILDIFLEVDRILRPEGWVIIRDVSSLIESTRLVTTRLKWDSRIIQLDTSSDEKLLVCQKPFFKKQL